GDSFTASKPARQTLRPWAATVRHAANGSPHSDALTLRKVCRAGSAGRGTPSALSTRAELSLSAPDPRRSLGPALEERAQPDRLVTLRADREERHRHADQCRQPLEIAPR